MTGFIASLVGSNPQDGHVLFFYFPIINVLHHIPEAKKNISKRNENI